MKIGIDISQAVYETGVSKYTRNLVKALLRIDKKNQYLLFGGVLGRRRELNSFVSSLEGNYKPRLFPFPPSLTDKIWNKLHILPIEYFLGDIDIFHSSDWTQPPSKAYKVTTVHDLVPIKFPELSHPRIISTHKSRLNWVKKEVDRIIVPSQATREDLKRLGVDNHKIIVVPEAPDPIFRFEPKSQIDKIKKKYKIRGKYLLAVGITPRKNTKRIIKAFKAIKNPNLELVIIGYPLMKITYEKGVIMPGAVPDEDLPALYTGAEVLVYPSLYEGFGLPILDAFTTNTAVVTSNTGSLKEVAGNAAVLVNPKKTVEIRRGIIQAIENREIFIQRGVKRVKSFTWKKVAKMTLDIYKSTK